jgi:hypothetical protein
MPYSTRCRTTGWLVLTGVGFCLLASVAICGAPQATSPALPAAALSNPKTRKPHWHNGPATMAPDTEIVPPHGSLEPPAVRSLTISVEDQRKGKAPAGASAAAPLKPATNISIDPDTRARNELNCLRNDSQARAAYYDELRRTAEQVREGGDPASEERKTSPCLVPNESPIGVGR